MKIVLNQSQMQFYAGEETSFFIDQLQVPMGLQYSPAQYDLFNVKKPPDNNCLQP